MFKVIGQSVEVLSTNPKPISSMLNHFHNKICHFQKVKNVKGVYAIFDEYWDSQISTKLDYCLAITCLFCLQSYFFLQITCCVCQYTCLLSSVSQ